jgi:uncharacterized phage-associated protein
MLARVSRKRAPVHPMTDNLDKTVAAISYLINEAREAGDAVTQYAIVKSIFLADRSHLNKYGRPVTFDNYVAMKDGPVPSLAYNLLKDNPDAKRTHDVAIPWDRKPAPHISPRAFIYEIHADRVHIDALSPSDIDELKAAFVVIKSLGFQQIRRLTHEDQAYIEAWEEGGSSKSYPISYSMLFDVPNPSAAETLSFFSKYV